MIKKCSQVTLLIVPWTNIEKLVFRSSENTFSSNSMHSGSEEINWYSHPEWDSAKFLCVNKVDDVNVFRRRKLTWSHCSRDKVNTCTCQYVTDISESLFLLP